MKWKRDVVCIALLGLMFSLLGIIALFIPNSEVYGMGLLLLLGGIVPLCYSFYLYKKRKDQNDWLKFNNVNINADYYFNNIKDKIQFRFIIDEENQLIFILKRSNEFFKIPFSSLSGVGVYRDNSMISGWGAVVGGVFAGGLGAIIGGLTADKPVKTYDIIIYTNNQQFEFPLIKTNRPEYDYTYGCAVDLADKISVYIKEIVKNNEFESSIPEVKKIIQQNTKTNTVQTIPEQIKALANLRKEGILTEEEFAKKKKEMLAKM